MNFKNVKIFFIILLLAVNIFLLVNFVSSDRKSSHIDAQTITNIVKILESNGISIGRETIPDEHFTSDIIEAEFDSGYYERVAAAVSLSEKESVNIMPDSSLKIIMKNGDQFSLDLKFRVEYVSDGLSMITAAEFAEMFSSKDTAESLGFAGSSLTGNEKKAVKAFLAPQELFQADSAFSYTVSSIYANGETKLAVCRQTIDGTEIRDHVMYIELKDGRVSRAAGMWFYIHSFKTYSADVYDQLSVLFEELDYKNSQLSDTDPMNSSYAITDMSFTYCIYWNTQQDGLFFIPAWKIATDNGETRFYNAVNCKLYE